MKKIIKKEDILGQIRKPKSGGNFIMDPVLAREPLHYDGSVIRCFCLGCGNSTELVPEGAEYLLKLAKAELPPLWQIFYFESKKCILCSDDYKDVVLKKIPQ
jgi:hypothetical protein